MPEECASRRSIARWVLPVLVGPSTAVTPAPGARSLENKGGEDEKAMISGSFCGAGRGRVFRKQGSWVCVRTREPGGQVFQDATHTGCIWGRGLSSGTSLERIGKESPTRPVFRFVHRNISHWLAVEATRSSFQQLHKRRFSAKFVKIFGESESNQKWQRVKRDSWK